MTEEKMLALLKQHYLFDRGVERDQWVFLPHTRDKAGMSGTRTADLVCMNMWPSRGLLIAGHEIKCSRSDWLSELKNPAKADAFHPHCDLWSLVIADPAMIHDGELPAGWGLMTVHTYRGTDRIKVLTKPEQKLPKPQELQRQFVAAMLKVAARQAAATPQAIADAVTEARAQERDHVKTSLERKDIEIAALRQREQEFQQASGVGFGRWHGSATPQEAGAAVRLVLEGKAQTESARIQLARLADSADQIAQRVRQLLQNDEDPF